MSDERRARREAQREAVRACRAAMPAGLEHLWETVLHAPSEALHAVSEVLGRSHAAPEARLVAILSWFGHGDGACPVCTMMVGKLVYTVPDPVAALVRACAGEAPPAALHGAALFVATQVELRHARPAGVTREGLTALEAELRRLPPDLAERLRAAWRERRGPEAELPALG